MSSRKSKSFSSRPPHDAVEFTQNMAQATQRFAQVVQEFISRQARNAMVAPGDPVKLANTYMEWLHHQAADPTRAIKRQMQMWEDVAHLWQHAAQRALGEESTPVIAPDEKDRRFRDEAWQHHPLFDLIKQSYLLSARWAQRAAQETKGLDEKTAHKIEFYTRQLVDALSPSNFLMTNPEVLRVTLETHGENLVQGLKRLLQDLEQGRVSMTDMQSFEVGRNLATTPGKVIFQNDLMQLIQYTPTTKEVNEVPLLIIPPWINKYYILDLQPENSLVRWLVEQGYTVFMISWVNPDKKLGRKQFDDYMLEGPVAALGVMEQATGCKRASVMGYCLGGTLLACLLSWLRAKKQASRIVSATYLTTLVDFEEAGDLSVFVDEDQLKVLEARMSEKGYLEGRDMALTFNMLRANDLIWSFVVSNYLLGKAPFPFDLLYWNSDATRMPAAMHSFYLRNMYQKNLLVKPGGITLAGVPIDIHKNNVPCYLLSTKEDHIAPWKSTYAATQIYPADCRFVLAASGHIAGVVNPPSKKKYVHWINHSYPKSPDQWLKRAVEHPGSWWQDWDKWQKPFAGKKVPARKVGGGKLKPIEDAPGSYVKVQS